ncbi:sulfotransferase family 2 domain-containing protein [Leeuwenhoekiella sp. A2]|uniref:sulfotransferase family 2 domain-containing protein n=1 Tax=Leeuwenhoekiella sp. A2 TaxID=3141460 RepID=UPI003A7FC2B4
MKTGGTSLNNMFINLSLGTKKEDLYSKLMHSPDLRIINNGWIYTAWNHLIVSSGLYHYAWSHRPLYKTYLSGNTFKITCIRHPYFRIFSRYKHISKEKQLGQLVDGNKKEYSRLGSSFSEYLSNCPVTELCHQLYMFSSTMNIEEGLKNLSKMDYIIDLDTFEEDIGHINKILAIELKVIHKRKNNELILPDLESSYTHISEKLKPELEFYYKAKELKNNHIN